MKIGNIECYGVIYKITNLIDGKCYIGQTITGFNRRYSGNILNTHNKHLRNSIEKYGVENFDICKIYDIAFSKKELDIKESFYIKLFDSTNPEKGYNLTTGGEGYTITEETRGRMSKAQKGKIVSEETIEKQRKVRQEWWNNLTEEEYESWRENLYILSGERNPFYGKGHLLSGENNPFYGRHHTEETKRQHSLDVSGENNYWYGKKGKNAPNTTAVICITTKAVFYTAKEGQKYYKCYNVGKCCKGEVKTAGKLSDGTKLIWRYLTIVEL